MAINISVQQMNLWIIYRNINLSCSARDTEMTEDISIAHIL